MSFGRLIADKHIGGVDGIYTVSMAKASSSTQGVKATATKRSGHPETGKHCKQPLKGNRFRGPEKMRDLP